MAGKLAGKVAIITGSGQGLGRDVALCMAKESARIVTNNRKPGSSINAFEKTALPFTDQEQQALETVAGDAQKTAEEIRRMGGEAIPFFGDAGDEDQCKGRCHCPPFIIASSVHP